MLPAQPQLTEMGTKLFSCQVYGPSALKQLLSILQVKIAVATWFKAMMMLVTYKSSLQFFSKIGSYVSIEIDAEKMKLRSVNDR